MPRPLKATAKQVQRARRDWYTFHFEQRRKALTLPVGSVQTYITATGYITPPQMTIFGGLPGDWPDRKAYELAAIWHLDIHLINSWYLTAEGWEQFQTLWQQLPEPVDTYSKSVHKGCVQIGDLYTITTLPPGSRPPG